MNPRSNNSNMIAQEHRQKEGIHWQEASFTGKLIFYMYFPLLLELKSKTGKWACMQTFESKIQNGLPT